MALQGKTAESLDLLSQAWEKEVLQHDLTNHKRRIKSFDANPEMEVLLLRLPSQH